MLKFWINCSAEMRSESFFFFFFFFEVLLKCAHHLWENADWISQCVDATHQCCFTETCFCPNCLCSSRLVTSSSYSLAELVHSICRLAHPAGQFCHQGAVSRTSRELFGPEKPFVKLRPAYSVKLVFLYVVSLRSPFLESPKNCSGPKSKLSNCNPLVLKS